MITPDMTISEILKQRPDAEGVFYGIGMYCSGCPAAQMETLKEASELYGFDPGDVAKRLNKTDKSDDTG